MITHLHLEYLGLAQLPVYGVGDGNEDFGRRTRYFTLDEGGQSWTICETARRVLVSLNIDTTVEALGPQLRSWLDMLKDEADGTLYFPIRNCASLPDDYGILLIAGCGFVPELEQGVALEGADPVPLIVEACFGIEQFREDHLGCTLDEVRPDLEGLHPVVQRAYWQVAQRWAEQQESERRSGEIELRSRTLLSEFLDADQLAELNRETQFHVQGADGHLYLIRKGNGHNVFRIEDGQPTIEYCLVCKGFVPTYDLMLTQKLLLEADPEMFLETANARILDAEKRPVMEEPIWPVLNAMTSWQTLEDDEPV